MSNYCVEWVLAHPGSVGVTNTMLVNPTPQSPHYWNALFSWAEIAIPGTPGHPDLLKVEQMAAHVTLILFRIAVIEELVDRAFGQNVFGHVCLAFLKLGKLFARRLGEKYKNWVAQYPEDTVGEVLEGYNVGYIWKSLSLARDTIRIM